MRFRPRIQCAKVRHDAIWRPVFEQRQKLAMVTLLNQIQRLQDIVRKRQSDLRVSRSAASATSLTRCASGRVPRLRFGGTCSARQALPMLWDFARMRSVRRSGGGLCAQRWRPWRALWIHSLRSRPQGRPRAWTLPTRIFPDRSAMVWFTDPHITMRFLMRTCPISSMFGSSVSPPLAPQAS